MDDEDLPTASRLAGAFGLDDVEDASLTRWATVHRATADGAPVVVKRTAATGERAAAMAGWTRAVEAAGVAVVSPADLDEPNPQQVGKDWWVVYPWVEGTAYAGRTAQVAQAGEFLGRLHAIGVDSSGLRPYAWPETERSDMEADLTTLEGVLGAQDASVGVATLTELGTRWWEESLPALRAAHQELARTGVSSDYKANNLVFTDGGPVLVDPDNGGSEPRLFDLAMAVVLFHAECDGAPGRLFSQDEWMTFATAYLAHVELTPAERELWPAALDHMLWEEGSWVIEDNDDAAWADPRQRGYLLDLAVATPGRYPLP